MRGKTAALLGLVGLLLSGCIFFSDEPALKRSDTFPGVGKWSCQDFSGAKRTLEIKRDGSGYRVDGDPAWFKALEKGFYLSHEANRFTSSQIYTKPTEEIPGKRYAYARVELEGNRLFFIYGLHGRARRRPQQGAPGRGTAGGLFRRCPHIRGEGEAGPSSPLPHLLQEERTHGDHGLQQGLREARTWTSLGKVGG